MLEQFKVKPEDAVRVKEGNLRSTVESIFRKMSLSEEDCVLGADVLVKADMRGVDTHGVSNMLRSYVSGYGQLIKPVEYSFQEDHIVVVKPSFHCSTSMIFSNYKLKKNDTCSLSLDSNSNVWKKNLVNNLESVTFSIYPELNNIKESLYSLGATYASMSGSGSSVYGLFKEKPQGLGELDHWVWEGVLSKFLK